MGTQRWLAFYVGKRLPANWSSQVKKIVVMCVSALWHGLYPGYYCTFLLASFWSEAEKKLFVAVRPISKHLPQVVRNSVAVVWTILLLNYMTVCARTSSG